MVLRLLAYKAEYWLATTATPTYKTPMSAARAPVTCSIRMARSLHHAQPFPEVWGFPDSRII